MNQPVTVSIWAGTCHLQLNLPIFFEEATLEKIRKVFKLLAVEPCRNESTLILLQRFFPLWQKALETRLESSKIAEKAALSMVRDAERQISCFGTMATKEMKSKLKLEQNKLRSATRAVRRSTADLERCGKIINAYNQITKF